MYFIISVGVFCMALVTLIAKHKVVSLTILLSLFGALTACSNNTSAPVKNAWNNIDTTQTRHRVQPGETIYSIAWRYNVSDEDLAKWNNLQKPYYLRIGQVLRLTPTANSVTTEAAAPTSNNVVEPTPTFTPVQSTKPAANNTATVASAATAIPAATTNKPSQATPVPGKGTWPRPVKGKLIAGYDQDGNKGVDVGVPVGTEIKAVQPGTVVYAGSNLRGYGQLIIIKQSDDFTTAYAHNSKLLVTEGQKVTTGQPIALSGDSEAAQPMLHFEVRKAGKPVDPMLYLK